MSLHAFFCMAILSWDKLWIWKSSVKSQAVSKWFPWVFNGFCVEIMKMASMPNRKTVEIQACHPSERCNTNGYFDWIAVHIQFISKRLGFSDLWNLKFTYSACWRSFYLYVMCSRTCIGMFRNGRTRMPSRQQAHRLCKAEIPWPLMKSKYDVKQNICLYLLTKWSHLATCIIYFM